MEIVITSPPDRDILVAEIYYDRVQWAELREDGGKMLIEIYKPATIGAWRFDFAEFHAAINQALTALARHGYGAAETFRSGDNIG